MVQYFCLWKDIFKTDYFRVAVYFYSLSNLVGVIIGAALLPILFTYIFHLFSLSILLWMFNEPKWLYWIIWLVLLSVITGFWEKLFDSPGYFCNLFEFLELWFWEVIITFLSAFLSHLMCLYQLWWILNEPKAPFWMIFHLLSQSQWLIIIDKTKGIFLRIS